MRLEITVNASEERKVVWVNDEYEEIFKRKGMSGMRQGYE